MKKMYLLINSLNGGGAEHVAARLSHSFSEKYDLKVLTLMPFTRDDYSFSGEKVSLYKYYTGKTWISKIKSVAKQIDKMASVDKPIVMLSFLQNSNLCLMMTKFRCKKIISIRNYLDFQYTGYKKFLWKILIKIYFNKADTIVSVSKMLNQDMINRYHCKSEKCQYIYNPYDVKTLFAQSKLPLQEKEKEFFDQHTVICNVGHLSPQKGQFSLVRILDELRKNGKNYGLVIVGKKEGAYAMKLVSLVKEYGLEEHVLFTGIQENPYKYIGKSFCFVFPSLYEGFPNALVEAMACRIPVIASDCKSGPREILIDANGKKYGVLVSCNSKKWIDKKCILEKNEREMIDAIKKLENDASYFESMSELAFKRAESFETDVIVSKWKEILD